jgi:hypothetical protein
MADMSGQSLPRLILTIILAAAVVALLGLGVMFRATDPLAPASGHTAPVTVPEVPGAEQAPPAGARAFERPVFHRDRAPGPDKAPASSDADPDAPDTSTAQSDGSEIRLRGIIIGERGARAALQGATAVDPTWVGKGDTVDGWTVETITADTVRLRNGDETVVIKFSRDE